MSRAVFTHQLDQMQGEENPLESIVNTIVFSSADWGQARDMAWLYGIVHGWDDEHDAPGESAMEDLAKQFNWPPEQVARLRRLHDAFTAMRGTR